ncbi:MAG: gluconeogenesis factor YvcK family protein [Candidatus Saccharibacteria bacterium]
MANNKGPKIVMIGGGTGSFTLLSGLKQYVGDITALVNMADDGGSTGQLRDELGVLPPGDVRQCLVALSNSPKVRDLFNYRFEEGTLKGHAFGNLFLTALEKMTGNFAEAVELASVVLRISGTVEPVTLTNVKLCMYTPKDKKIIGEHKIGRMRFKNTRPKFWLEPKAKLNPRAKEAILNADMVVVAPGNLYGSLAPALIVPGIAKTLKESKAKKVYVCNLVTKPGQTDGFKIHDFAEEIERLAGCQFLDYVVFNSSKPNEQLLQKYANDGEFAVDIDNEPLKRAHYKAKGADIISDTINYKRKKGDLIARTLIRHDPDKVAKQLMRIYFS